MVWALGCNLIHEIEKLAPAGPGVMPGFHAACEHMERCEQGRRSVAFVAVAKYVHGFAVGQNEDCPLQRQEEQAGQITDLIGTRRVSFIWRI